jgi:putative transposase
MSRDTTVIPFRQPEAIDDPLSEVAREGARRMLAQVLIADAFVAMWKDFKLPDGRDRVVRHGHGPTRSRAHSASRYRTNSRCRCAVSITASFIA